MTRDELKELLKEEYGTITKAAAIAELSEPHLTMILNGNADLSLTRLGGICYLWKKNTWEISCLLSYRDKASYNLLRVLLFTEARNVKNDTDER